MNPIRRGWGRRAEVNHSNFWQDLFKLKYNFFASCEVMYCTISYQRLIFAYCLPRYYKRIDKSVKINCKTYKPLYVIIYRKAEVIKSFQKSVQRHPYIYLYLNTSGGVRLSPGFNTTIGQLCKPKDHGQLTDVVCPIYTWSKVLFKIKLV